MIKIPYGISNYATLIREGNHYVDRTPYIEVLENFNAHYLFFVRPRRFGKSLFISTLEHYYDIEHKNSFHELFGNQYIGQNPTKSANKYLTLVFDFSGIDTSSFENTQRSFLNSVLNSCRAFLGKYAQFFNQKDIEELNRYSYPSEVIQHLLTTVELKASNYKIYLLIDEYDHFANEILAFRFDEFNNMVGTNGFVRKFYESLKTATRDGVIDRLFVTGVSPITLDSLTSGFNIATNISLEEDFNAMMGFKQAEVETILKKIEVPDGELGEVQKKIKGWYNGYLFSKYAEERVYNSDMVLYFALHYGRKKRYPDELLDPNIVSDYTKIQRLFNIKNKEEEHLTYLKELLKTGTIESKLIREFDLARRFEKYDFISLLYYMGILTISEGGLDDLVFKMPNFVIEQLYYQYFHQIILEESNLTGYQTNVHQKIKVLALQNDIQPLVKYTEAILSELSSRDKISFDEKYIKIIFTSAFYTSGIYTIHNEFEVKRSKTEKGYVDILLITRPPHKPKYQFVIELKYLKKATAAKATIVKKEAVQQLKNYLTHDDYLQKLHELKAYVILFVGNVGEVVEVE
ncbi:MAG: AAA family ATPase [Chitinophagales bacterium]